MTFQVSSVDDAVVEGVSFVVQFRQTVPVSASVVESAGFTIQPGVSAGTTADSSDGGVPSELADELAELNVMMRQLAALEYAISSKMQHISETFDVGPLGGPHSIAECDSLVCIWKSMYSRVKHMASRLYGHSIGHGGHFRHRLSGHHWPFPHPEEDHGHYHPWFPPHPDHPHRNHSHIPPHEPHGPPPHRPPPHGPPPHGPPPHGPPPHGPPPHGPPPHGPPPHGPPPHGPPPHGDNLPPPDRPAPDAGTHDIPSKQSPHSLKGGPDLVPTSNYLGHTEEWHDAIRPPPPFPPFPHPGRHRFHVPPILYIVGTVVFLAAVVGIVRICCCARSCQNRHSRCTERRRAREARRQRRGGAWAARCAAVGAMCFEVAGRVRGSVWGREAEAEAEEKAAIMRSLHASDGDETEDDALSTTIEQELAQFRAIADVVGSMVAAEEGRSREYTYDRPRHDIPAPAPRGPTTAFPDYASVDEELPAYDEQASEHRFVADGFRYTHECPSYSSSCSPTGPSTTASSLDEHLGGKD
ncbi:hypothetical protein GGS23DRAFT_274532 [Durotheca rogersii]|uniref:uncharacterized protein n=1 Tax=Durotheca rogersii TaxID=419775 RepID=UPI00221EDEF1|nr:uncharacterized protein GGS23DRAFT_274532 [Durotheca rogersii]KAI5866503.1 hypothetical protein GGS23DRAFT_274532 [Durotheca rogersii]